MTITRTQRIVIWHWLVASVIVITHKIIPISYQVPLTKPSPQRRVIIVDSGIDNSNLDPLPGEPQASQLVHLGHDMRGPRIMVSSVLLALADCAGRGRHGVVGAGSPSCSAEGMQLHGPESLDCGHSGDLRHSFIVTGGVVEPEGGAVEEGIAQVERGRDLNVCGAKVAVEPDVILALL